MATTSRSHWNNGVEYLSRDVHLGPVIARIKDRPDPPACNEDPFPSLVRSIVYQQLNGNAAGAIHARVIDAIGGYESPKPEAFDAVDDDKLRAAGLSRSKLAAIRDLVAHTKQGTLPDLREVPKLSDDELIKRLTVVRGVGPWTVQMWMMFDLGRPDVWPVSDFGLRSAVTKLWRKRRMADVQFMNRVGRAWRPWRTVASWYLWRSHELPGE